MSFSNWRSIAAIVGLVGAICIVSLASPWLLGSTPPIKQPDYCEAYHAAKNSPGQRVPDFWETTWCDPISYFTFWITGFTGVLALVSCAQLWALGRANAVGVEAARAAKLSADALVSAERAHLFVRVTSQSVQQQITGASMRGPEWDGGHLSPPLHVSYVIKNFGKTPAILREISHDLDVFSELPAVPSYSAPIGLPYQRVLGFGDETPPIDCDCRSIVTVDQAREIAMGKSSVWLVGRVVYEDIITGQTHTEPFLYRYAGDGFEADYRPAYNQRT